MSKLQETLDIAIGKAEQLKGGYVTRKGKSYSNYQCNQDWTDYINKMSTVHQEQYDNGGGGELKEKIYPPKMASFGSSSRMIYECSKDIPDFTFEKKLETNVGGTANLDGFISNGSRNLYVEAKRREIYVSHNKEAIKVNYRKVYEFIESKTNGLFKYVIDPGKEEIEEKDSTTKVMKGHFELNGECISYFDMKQIICHFLGITYDLAKQESPIHEVKFLYLIFNPEQLYTYMDDKSYSKIMTIYKKAIFDKFQADTEKFLEHIFYLVLKYQIEENHFNEMRESDLGFTFKFVDQNDYKEEIRVFNDNETK